MLIDLACSDFPLLEKLNIFQFYQAWSSKSELPAVAIETRDECKNYLESRDRSSDYHIKLLHWKYDLLAQLRKDCLKKQQYGGFKTLVELSWGNPRHLLIILKHVVSWAAFKGQGPFDRTTISVQAQSEGVREAADWFFSDARMTGPDGRNIQDAIGRLGTLLRSIRYSDKPSECSASGFSYSPASVSERTRGYVELATKLLFIIPAGDQRDRNSMRMDAKYQLNRMLAPKWDVSYSLRGIPSLSGDEVNAIFDPEYVQNFDDLLAIRVDRMTAPFVLSTAKRKRLANSSGQQILPGLEDD